MLSRYQVRPKHTLTRPHTFTSGQQMPKFTYDYGGGAVGERAHMLGSEYGHISTNVHHTAHSLSLACTHAHVPSSSPSCYNEMGDSLCQRGDGVTLRLYPAGTDPVTSSSDELQRLQPGWRGGSNLSYREELETLCAALS